MLLLFNAYFEEFAALMVAFPHIDILNKLASLVNVHLLIYVTNVGIHGMRRYHQLVRDIRCGVSSGDKFKDFLLRAPKAQIRR